MKCYYPPGRDAVGICSPCGKAAYRQCVEDIGGALLCKDCLALAKDRAVAEQQAASKKARRSILSILWIVF